MSESALPIGPNDPAATDIQDPATRLVWDADTLRRALDEDTGLRDTGGEVGAAKGAVLAVLCGLPGTGKSYFARELLKRAPMTVLETDRLRKILVPKPKYTPAEHARVFTVCHVLIEEYLSQDRRVLFDATNLTEGARKPMYQMAARLGCPLVLVGFTAPIDLIKQRLAQRVPGQNPGDFSDADWQIHRRMRPYEQPIQRRHIIVDTSQDISWALDRVVDDMSNAAPGYAGCDETAKPRTRLKK